MPINILSDHFLSFLLIIEFCLFQFIFHGMKKTFHKVIIVVVPLSGHGLCDL